MTRLLSCAFIRDDLNAATRDPFRGSLISVKKRQLISDRIKRLLVAVFRSPLMKALDRIGVSKRWVYEL